MTTTNLGMPTRVRLTPAPPEGALIDSPPFPQAAIRELGKDALPALSTLEDLHGVGAQTKYQSHMPQPVIQALAEVLTRN